MPPRSSSRGRFASSDRAEDVLVATKGGHVRTTAGGWQLDGRAYIRRAARESARRLGVEAIWLYRFHRPDPAVSFAESVGALAAAADLALSDDELARLRDPVDRSPARASVPEDTALESAGQRRRAAGTGLPVGDRHRPAAFSPCAQKWRIRSQLRVLNAPVVRMRAVSRPGPQSIVPLP